MTSDEALKILAEATQPQAVGRITREGYAQINEALAVIAARLAQANAPKPEA